MMVRSAHPAWLNQPKYRSNARERRRKGWGGGETLSRWAHLAGNHQSLFFPQYRIKVSGAPAAWIDKARFHRQGLT
jgi:hypothetical protein